MFCGQDEFVFKQKLACVPQATLIELLVCEISLRNRASLSWPELSEMCEHETSTALCFEAQ